MQDFTPYRTHTMTLNGVPIETPSCLSLLECVKEELGTLNENELGFILGVAQQFNIRKVLNGH